MGTVSVHSGSKGCESSDLWDTSPPNHSPIRPLWSGIGCLRSQSTLRTGLNEMYQSVRCTSGGTSSAVHTSTAARVLSTAPTPPTLPAGLAWQCTKRRVLLAQLSHTRCGLMHHRPRVCGRSACVGTLSMHTTAHVYETQTAIPSEIFFPAN